MGNVTDLLADLAAGNQAAAERLWPLVHEELRGLAVRHLRREVEPARVSVTALVDEAYLRLTGENNLDWRGRAHFLAVASGAIRRILIDHARARHSKKRGEGRNPLELTEQVDANTGDSLDLLALHEALTDLEAVDARQARVVELRFFGGLSVKETAHVLNVSERTVKGDWALARVFLHQRLDPAP